MIETELNLEMTSLRVCVCVGTKSTTDSFIGKGVSISSAHGIH